jgi:hypothetical protein
LLHARREATIIGLAWLAAMTYCCTYCYLFGYRSQARPLTINDIRPILGMPSWIFWGVIAPWLVCAVFTFVFAGFFMVDDDLGKDHSEELNLDIREGGLHE